jgi:hypothetical protein
MALSAQHPLSLQDMSHELQLQDQSSGWRHGVIAGPVAVFPESISRQRTATLQNDPGNVLSPEIMSLNCRVAVDPRVKIVGIANPVFSEVTDDAGNSLVKPPTDPERLETYYGGPSLSFRNAYASLAIPAKKGTRITSAKGKVHFVVQTAEDRLDIADPQTKNGQLITFAGTTFTLDRFTVQNNGGGVSVSFSLGSQSSRDIFKALPNLGGQEPPAPTLTVLDANGRVAMTTVLRGNSGGSLMGNYTPPFKLRLSIPTKTKELTFPFGLQDLPLP